MSLAIRMNILGTRQLDFAIKGLLRQVSDWRPLWPRVRDAFWRLERAQFASEGAVGARGKWRSLKPGYARAKSQRARHARSLAEMKKQISAGEKILVRTGTMKRSLTSQAVGTIADLSNPVRMTIGTSITYAMYHQTGTSRMPPRRPIDFTARQNLTIAKEFHTFLNKDALKQFGKKQIEMPMGVRS